MENSNFWREKIKKYGGHLFGDSETTKLSAAAAKGHQGAKWWGSAASHSEVQSLQKTEIQWLVCQHRSIIDQNLYEPHISHRSEIISGISAHWTVKNMWSLCDPILKLSPAIPVASLTANSASSRRRSHRIVPARHRCFLYQRPGGGAALQTEIESITNLQYCCCTWQRVEHFDSKGYSATLPRQSSQSPAMFFEGQWVQKYYLQVQVGICMQFVFLFFCAMPGLFNLCSFWGKDHQPVIPAWSPAQPWVCIRTESQWCNDCDL